MLSEDFIELQRLAGIGALVEHNENTFEEMFRVYRERMEHNIEVIGEMKPGITGNSIVTPQGADILIESFEQQKANADRIRDDLTDLLHPKYKDSDD